jgi:hypothetical protein
MNEIKNKVMKVAAIRTETYFAKLFDLEPENASDLPKAAGLETMVDTGDSDSEYGCKFWIGAARQDA